MFQSHLTHADATQTDGDPATRTGDIHGSAVNLDLADAYPVS